MLAFKFDESSLAGCFNLLLPKLPRIPQTVAESFSREADGGKLQALKEQVERFNSKFAGQMEPSSPAGGQTSRTPGPARTQDNPTIGGACHC